MGLTALVAKSSAGAMEHLAVAKVANIHQTVLDLQKAGIWVYAAEAGGSAHYDTNFSGPCALVMGSEGEGVSRVVKETCDGIVSIPMYGHVNSFNVSTAASVILAEIARQEGLGNGFRVVTNAGADGGIGTTYNIMPDWFCSLYDAFRAGDLSRAQQLQFRINRVIEVLRRQPSIIAATKEVFRYRGIDVGPAAYPAYRYSAETSAVMQRQMRELGVPDV